MKSSNEVIDAVDRCAKDCGIYCRGCAYEKDDGDCRDKLLRDDIIYYLKLLQVHGKNEQPKLPGFEKIPSFTFEDVDFILLNMQIYSATMQDINTLIDLNRKYFDKDSKYLYQSMKKNGGTKEEFEKLYFLDAKYSYGSGFYKGLTDFPRY